MRREQGFTIPELLVVMAVIVLMTGLVLPNWRSGEQSLALDRAVHRAGQDVRRAQELALRAEPHACQTGSIFAYGIFFDSASPASYFIFADCDADSIGYDQGADDVIETITLESGVAIQGVSPSSQVSFVFVPPIPTTYIKPDDPSSAQISFQRADGQGSARILDISNKGLIDIN